MTSRNPRRHQAQDMLPGMPDRVNGCPPKAAAEPEAMTLDQAIARSHQILDRVLAAYPVVAVFALFSGGNDSVVLAHLFRQRVNAVVHVNTGTGIPETTRHVRAVTAAWGLPLHELHPRDAYRDLVLGNVAARTGPNTGRPVWKGFPGPAGHPVMYRRLKDEPLQRLRARIVGRAWRTRNVVYLAGMRWAETSRRFRTAEEVDREGSLIWVSPIVHWTTAHLREYRDRYRCDTPHHHAAHRLCHPGSLPLNEVTTHLHMSGECLCGAYAKPGELEEIAFFYPHAAAPLRALQRDAEAAGLAACTWGQKPPGARTHNPPPGRSALCANCPLPGQDDLFTHWLNAGLLTPTEHDDLTRRLA
jgi:3'-phosphoadenosine 5'-phosphosulfate sulfotransferase (PAPS reductase)/FAD synthetase